MTPLHEAIINDDFTVLNDQAFIDRWREVADGMGFLPIEIAKFLGKYKALELIGGKLPVKFNLQPNGMDKPVELSLSGFEKGLGFRYRPYLTFSSYSSLQEVVGQCPYILRNRIIARENYEWNKSFRKELSEGLTAPLFIKWIDPILGYGAFTSEEIPSGTFVGEYTGIVRRLYRRHPDQNPYCFHYPTKLWSLKYYTVDSMKEGNITRFINHSSRPNLLPICVVDRKLLHLVFVAGRTIKTGEQLTFDYGNDYWRKES
jgi:hypothetical protein